MSKQEWKGAEEDVGHVLLEVQGELSHQPCLKVSLIQATTWKRLFLSPEILWPGCGSRGSSGSVRPGAPTPNLIPEPLHGLSIFRDVMGEKFLSPHPQPGAVTGHVPCAGSPLGTPQLWILQPLCPSLASISTENSISFWKELGFIS